MLTLITVLGAVMSAFHLRTLIMNEEEHRTQLQIDQLEQNGDHKRDVSSIWNYLIERYGVPIAHYFVSVIYSVYVQLTILNVVCIVYS